MRRRPATAALLLLLLLPAPSGAVPLEWSVGLKAGGGADVWLAPDAPQPFTDHASVFVDDRAGWSYGGGLFAELRLFTYLAFELDVLFFQHERIEEAVWQTGPGLVDIQLSWTTLRIPFLVKGVLPLGTSRLWIGVGPEAAVTLASSHSADVREAPRADVPSVTTRNAHDAYLTATVGGAFSVDPLTLTAELRVSYNLTQPGDHAGRVTHDARANELSLRADSSVDARLVVGLAYEF